MSCPYYEEARLRKRRAEERLEADTQKQQRLEGKRQEKAFEQAMVESPMGDIYEAQPAAEPGESVIFKNMTQPLGDWVLMKYLVHRW